jgi:hypothetical protein
MEQSFVRPQNGWAYAKSSLPRGRLGKTPYVECLVGTIRRERLDHVIIFNEPGLRRLLRNYFQYYEQCAARISPWTKMFLSLALSNLPRSAL